MNGIYQWPRHCHTVVTGKVFVGYLHTVISQLVVAHGEWKVVGDAETAQAREMFTIRSLLLFRCHLLHDPRMLFLVLGLVRPLIWVGTASENGLWELSRRSDP